MLSLPQIDPTKQTQAIIKFIQTTFKQHGFKQGVVAVSGGLDSAVVLLLSAQALGPENIYVFHLPYKTRHRSAAADLVVDLAQIPQSNRQVINLSRAVDKLAVKLNAKKHQLRFGNLLVRLRMACIFDQAKKHQALVIGTSNKSEILLGYYTRYGDSAADLRPLAHLYKTQVYQLAKHLDLPQSVIDTPPSANLWPGQTDAQELGFTYQQADPILYLLADKHLSSEKIIDQGFNQSLVKQVVNRFNANKFKTKVPYEPD